MLQETTTQPVEVVDQAIKFGAIAFNVAVMTVTCVCAMAVYALKSIKTEVATVDWVKSNRFRWALGFLILITLSALTVLTPDINIALAALGFNADKSPVALGLAISLLLIGATSEPSAAPEGDGK